MYIANRSVNTLHYNIFGHSGRNKATLMDRVDPQLSLICKSMGEVYEALTTFGAGTRMRHLLIILDADFTSAELRQCCRKQLLGVGIGLEDMFGIPMPGPPSYFAPLVRGLLEGDEASEHALTNFFELNGVITIAMPAPPRYTHHSSNHAA